MSGVDSEIGWKVRKALWRAGRHQRDLALRLGVDPAAVSRRLSGTVAWRVSEVMTAAAVCGVDLRDLLPAERPEAVGA